ncbi:toxin-antitoxin system HicB family antitoxin [Exiguobacterium sp. PFWT01]
MKSLTVRLDEELHKEMKIQAINEGMTIQKYLVSLIKADLEKKKQQK